MVVQRPVLIIEDDLNDSDVMKTAISELGVKNDVKIFVNAKEALEYLMVTEDRPLLILSDVRMPGLDGLTFLKSICSNDYLRKKSIPFVFFTGVINPDIVNRAYEMGVQGFFKKATNYMALKDQLLAILIYWKQSIHPNSEIM